MIRITRNLYLREQDLDWQFVRSSGPGGQNVNKVATAVELRFQLANATYLPERLRERLMTLAGRRIGKDGALLVQARRHRTQARNRQEALARLIALISEAGAVPKRRIGTKPTKASRERRLQAKRQQSRTKRLRGDARLEDV